MARDKTAPILREETIETKITVPNFTVEEVLEDVVEAFPDLEGQFIPNDDLSALLKEEANSHQVYSWEHFINHIGAVLRHQVSRRGALDPQRGLSVKPPAWDTIGFELWTEENAALQAYQQVKGDEGARDATLEFFKMSPEERKAVAQEAKRKLAKRQR